MRSKILVRILIVLLAVFLVFRIHERVETYRVPREFCRTQMNVIARACIQHMFESEGNPAPDLDSLLSFAEENGYFETFISSDSITVSFYNGKVRKVEIPSEWHALWNESAVEDMEADLIILLDEHTRTQRVISDHEESLGFSLDSLLTLREIFIIEHPSDEDESEGDEVLSPGEYFDDSLGFNAGSLIDTEVELAVSISSLESMLSNFNNIIAPARRDSVAALVAAVCPTVWEAGFYDSVYSYDPKLSLGTQFSISCPNYERHGGVVGGLAEKDYPDSMFLEPDWSETQFVYSFPEYAEMRRLQASRANLIRAAEEEAAYLGQRYPTVIIPKDPNNLEMGIDDIIDPLGGEYVFELVPDTSYVFYENPSATSRRFRGDSVTVETVKFVGYTTSDPEVSRVEVYLSHPITFPSRSEGATPGSNDMVTVIYYWDRSDLGTLQIDEREVDLLDEPRWDFLRSKFGISDNPITE